MADAPSRAVMATLSDAAMTYPDFPADPAGRLTRAWPALDPDARRQVSDACIALELAWDGDDAAEAYRRGTALGALLSKLLQNY